MLHITLEARESWDPRNEIFVETKEYKLTLEHSLISISKWEAKWHVPFLARNEKTNEQLIDYIRCMTITQNIPDEAYYALSNKNLADIHKYIDDPATATIFSNTNNSIGKVQKEEITSELMYYWMVAHTIPFECQRWHLNRLITLIQVCNIKNQPAKKMSKTDIRNRNAAINAARRRKYNSKG